MGSIAGRVTSSSWTPPAVLARLLQPIETNSLGRSSTWTAAGVFLAHLETATSGLSADNPAGVMDRFRIAADARLDDRASLAASLGVDAHRLSDAELIIVAYGKWGPDCVAHLTGDFAFALWDVAARRLFCARDHIGIRPLYYRNEADGLSFASSLASLSRPDDRLDPGRIAAFIDGFDDSFDDTMFGAIRRLPPAHWLLWTPQGVQLQRYWTLTAEDVGPNEDFAAGFRERFFQAVDDRLHGAPDIGAMLSGGLDSSSIVSVAASRHRGDPGFNLRTFSFAYPDSPQFDEREFGEAVREAYGLECQYVDMDDLAPLDGLADLAGKGEDVFFAPGIPKIARVLASAHKSGIRVVLDGHGGDEVASHGFGRLSELARDGRWFSLYRELRGVSSLYGGRPLPMLGRYYFSQGTGLKLRNRLLSVRPQSSRASRPDTGSLLAPDFAATGNFVERASTWQAAYRRATADETSLHTWNVSSPVVSRSFETLARVADHVGVELRFPFYDRRLVAYALAVPESEKLQNGWTRSVLRRAMKDILPEKVRWRRTKIDFGSELAEGLARHHKGRFSSLLRKDGPIGEYVDLATARALAARLFDNPAGVTPRELFALWRIAFLGMWLDGRSTSFARESALI